MSMIPTDSPPCIHPACLLQHRGGTKVSMVTLGRSSHFLDLLRIGNEWQKIDTSLIVFRPRSWRIPCWVCFCVAVAQQRACVVCLCVCVVDSRAPCPSSHLLHPCSRVSPGGYVSHLVFPPDCRARLRFPIQTGLLSGYICSGQGWQAEYQRERGRKRERERE